MQTTISATAVKSETPPPKKEGDKVSVMRESGRILLINS